MYYLLNCFNPLTYKLKNNDKIGKYKNNPYPMKNKAKIGFLKSFSFVILRLSFIQEVAHQVDCLDHVLPFR